MGVAVERESGVRESEREQFSKASIGRNEYSREERMTGLREDNGEYRATKNAASRRRGCPAACHRRGIRIDGGYTPKWSK